MSGYVEKDTFLETEFNLVVDSGTLLVFYQ